MGALVLVAYMLAGCGSSSDTSKLPEELVVQFVPSRELGEILEATKPLS